MEAKTTTTTTHHQQIRLVRATKHGSHRSAALPLAGRGGCKTNVLVAACLVHWQCSSIARSARSRLSCAYIWHNIVERSGKHARRILISTARCTHMTTTSAATVTTRADGGARMSMDGVGGGVPTCHAKLHGPVVAPPSHPLIPFPSPFSIHSTSTRPLPALPNTSATSSNLLASPYTSSLQRRCVS